jgi:hypothetical protein
MKSIILLFLSIQICFSQSDSLLFVAGEGMSIERIGSTLNIKKDVIPSYDTIAIWILASKEDDMSNPIAMKGYQVRIWNGDLIHQSLSGNSITLGLRLVKDWEHFKLLTYDKKDFPDNLIIWDTKKRVINQKF